MALGQSNRFLGQDITAIEADGVVLSDSRHGEAGAAYESQEHTSLKMRRKQPCWMRTWMETTQLRKGRSLHPSSYVRTGQDPLASMTPQTLLTFQAKNWTVSLT
ncbi:hypothetical protein EYF80_010502 [Liparis tanakae]|uniref:Uncharacterized protein n=1 Tax=Liparis tanakae TaxID=230148 RepID=A0A4Z2INA7_9TELE|nr:hypothetical protein EYF80_010502 [Liparis tanakae]